MEKFQVVCFDVDGTLVDGISWFLLTEGLHCSVEKHIELYSRAKQGELSFAEAESHVDQNISTKRKRNPRGY